MAIPQIERILFQLQMQVSDLGQRVDKAYCRYFSEVWRMFLPLATLGATQYAIIRLFLNGVP